MTTGSRCRPAIITAAVLAIWAMAGAADAQAAGLPGGATSLSESFGDWGVACRVVDHKGSPGRVCALAQRQTNRKGQLTFAMELRPQGSGAKGVMVLPFGVAVTKGVQLALGKTRLGGSRPFSTCLPVGCLVPLGFDGPELERLRSGRKVTLTAIALPGKKFSISVPLKGFAGALKRTRELLK